MQTFLEGFALSAGLIIAIGAQNVLVLTEGLKRRYVFTVATMGSLSDALLIAAGAAGFGTVVAQSAALRMSAGWGGALFLFVYGAMAFRRALRPATLDADATAREAVGSKVWRRVVLTMLAVTFLNPHVYLDTVLLLGAVAGQYSAADRSTFTFGAIAASGVWFYTLGYGARWVAPLFASPSAWRILDVLVGMTMWSIAVALVRNLT